MSVCEECLETVEDWQDAQDTAEILAEVEGISIATDSTAWASALDSIGLSPKPVLCISCLIEVARIAAGVA